MTVSDLIVLLETKMEQYGDRSVVIRHDEFEFDNFFVYGDSNVECDEDVIVIECE